METKVIKKGSAIRRSLMAFVIAATPLVAVASVSGVAQAGANEVTAEVVCGEDGAYIDIDFNNTGGGGGFYSIWVDSTRVLFDKSPGHINNKKIAEGLLGSSVFVEVFTEGESGTLVESFNLTVDCDGIQTISCANRSNPVITVTTPENGSSYDAYLYEGDVTIDFSDLPDGFVDSALGIDDGTSVELLPGGNGIFTVALDGNGGNDSSFTVDVDCPRKKRSTTPTTAPVLPSTGSDSNTLLVIAPMMVLLGGALIVARRRLVNA